MICLKQIVTDHSKDEIRNKLDTVRTDIPGNITEKEHAQTIPASVMVARSVGGQDESRPHPNPKTKHATLEDIMARLDGISETLVLLTRPARAREGSF